MADKNFRMQVDLSGLGKVAPAVRRRLRREIAEALAGIEAHAKDAMAEPKSGRIYGEETAVSFKSGDTTVSFTAHRGRKLGDDRVHQASAPGEAPAIDEGNLVNSMASALTSETQGEFRVAAEYGAPLEFGTDDGQIAPRPFVGPAVEHVEPIFVRACAEAVRKACEEGEIA